MRMPPNRFLMPVLVVSLLQMSACGDDPTRPTIASVAGDYVAINFLTTNTNQTENQLQNGATVNLHLDANGTTAGRLFVPGAGEDGADLDVNLSGTWTLSGNIVNVHHAADAFLRDMPLTVSGNSLVGDRFFSETRVQLTLTKD